MEKYQDVVEEILSIGQEINELRHKLVLREADHNTLHYGLAFIMEKLLLVVDKIMESKKL